MQRFQRAFLSILTPFSSTLSKVICAGILLAGLLGGVQPAAADLGPVSPSGHPIVYLGVTYFAKYDGLSGQDSTELDAIINALGGSTYVTGAAYDVQLVIESEIGWDATEPQQGDYSHFGPYQQFAQLIQSKGLVWTPLLSYHYVPGWVSTKYANDAMPSAFMPFVPTSAVWSGEAATWTRQALQALSPYFGSPIKVVLCGNEMLTAKRSSDPAVLTAADFDARSRDWANALTTLVNAAKSVVQGQVPVTTKLVPYELHATEMLQRGMFPHAYDLLDSLDVVAIDTYPPADAEYQGLFRSDKATYVSEFNLPGGGATGDQLLSWVELGVSRYNLRYAAWFCWQCGAEYSMTADEQRGMRDAINWIRTLGAVYSLPSRSVSFQLSTDILGKSDSSWMVHPAEASRHTAALSLGARLPFPVRYEVDYRPRTAGTQIAQIVDYRSVDTFGKHAIYLLEDLDAQVSAPEGTFYTSGNSCCSEATVAYSPSLAAGTQVFDWTPWWSLGVRKLEKQQLWLAMGAVRDWVVSPDGVPVAEQFGSSFFIAQGTLFELDNHPERPLPTLLGDMINYSGCGEGSCVASQGAYVSHFTGSGCTGIESYYLPYDGYAYQCRTWDGGGQCGTIHRTVTNRSYRYNGVCYDAWPSGNTLSDFVTVYR
jgi:hypothetical protein